MNQFRYVGRKMRQPELKKDPAIVIAAFGSTNRYRRVLDLFQAELERCYPEAKIYWAYTSGILRKKFGLPSLQETLAKVEADGYRKAVVQTLHIFPGTEYQQLEEICGYFPGIRIFLGETLLHRWEFVKHIIKAVEPEFLQPDQGCNLLALHGTPLASDPVNIVYLGIEKYLSDIYPNVVTASIEGVPDIEATLTRIKREGLSNKYHRCKIIPMMYFAGIHAEEDLMGEENSWKSKLTEMGFEVECARTRFDGQNCFKGLGYYPEVNRAFLDRLDRIIKLARFY